MFFKKGQGISLDVIVIAAVVLIVMVVLITIFLGRAGQTGQELASCQNKGGTCIVGKTCDASAGWSRLPENCPPLPPPPQGTGESQVCCVKGFVQGK